MRRLMALAALGLLVTGCGGQLAAGSEDEVKIGFVPKSLNQEFWVNTKKGAEAGGKSGHARVITQAAGSDLEIAEQIDIVENLLVQDIDALVIAPASDELLKPVLERAAAKVPVVLVDSDIADWKPKTSYVGTENVDGGVKAGKYIASKLKDGGTLAIIAGIPGSQVGIDRVDGLKKGLKDAGSKIKIVKEIPGNFDREQSVGAMEDILQTNPDIEPSSARTTRWPSARSSRSALARRPTTSCSSASTVRSRRRRRSSPATCRRPSPRTLTAWARSVSRRP